MDAAHLLIAEAATKLAAEMPADHLKTLACAIESASAGNIPVAKDIPHLHYRNLATKFLDLWKKRAPATSPEAVALALRTAAHAEIVHRDTQSTELVWTGPGSDTHPFRRTEQAILQVLDSAQQRITLVSYAVYRIPNVRESLVRAARRGVQINGSSRNPVGKPYLIVF
jgi:phosphatidylserine/phosphatidylglycerophosphate/cardiolipin synthase-like enzyme